MAKPSRAIEAILLTSQDCLLCHETQAELNELASEVPLVITTVDAASPQGAALAEQYGLPFTPGLILGGEAFGYGRLSQRALRREIERRCPNVTTDDVTVPASPTTSPSGRVARALRVLFARDGP